MGVVLGEVTQGEEHMNIQKTVQIFSLMMQGPFSRLELAKRTNSCPKAVGRVISELKAQRMIYVVGYTNETDGRNRVKIYTLGDGVDAQPLRSQSQENRSRRSYLKKVAVRKQANIKTTFVGGKGLWQ
jgi:hypothetical protein